MQCTTLSAAALILIAAGSLDAQQATSLPRPDRPIPEWLVLGTFPVDSGPRRIDIDYLGGETAAAASNGESTSGKQWRVARSDAQGRVDFNRTFEAPLERAAGYALAYITASSERTVAIALESDDDAVAWLNGTRIYRAEVARGIGQADTIAVRLSRGVNRLLVKVVNRSGGFGLGARLLGMSAGSIEDLAVAAAKPAAALAGPPAPWVTMSPAKLAAEGRLQDGELLVDVTMDVTRWGGVSGPVQLAIGTRNLDVPASADGLPVRVRLAASWPELADFLAEPAVAVTWPGKRVFETFPLRASDLLAVLSRNIRLHGWERSSDGAAWQPMTTSPDSTAAAIRLRTTLPPVLAGLTLVADVAELVPGGTFTVNGATVQPDGREQLVLCAPCSNSQPLEIVVRPGTGDWWDPPRLRVQEIGWRELEDAARFAEVLGAGSAPLLQHDSVHTLLRLAARADKRAYLAMIDRLRAPLRPFEARLRADTIDLIGNSHIDAAWLWRWPETVEVTRNTWRTAVKLLDKYPEMKFAASSAKYYTWLEEYEPQLLEKIKELQRQGRWIVTGGWWVEPDVNTPSGESLARQGLYGQRTITRIFGAPATVGWIPDTFGYPWTLPQLMAQAGLTSFVTQKLRWNENGWSAGRNFFWWEGPDGTRIPTYIPFGYDHDLRASRLAQEWRTQRDSAATTRVLTLYGVGDHGGGPTMEMLDRKRDAERIPLLPVLRDTDPAQSLATMISSARNAPGIRDELYFEYHRGVQTSQAAMKQWNRRMENLLASAEIASVAAGGEYPRAALTQAWQKTLFNQFHDILPGSSIAGVYVDALADYRAADSLASTALRGALARIADRMDTRPPVNGAVPYLIFNATSTPRSDIVSLPGAALRELRVLDAAGRELPALAVRDSLQALVRDVPALGTAVVFVAPARSPVRPARAAASHTLENDSLLVVIDSVTGAIARLYDKRLRSEVLASGAQGNVLRTMHDLPQDWDAWNIDHTNGPWTTVDSAVTVGRVTRTALGDELTVLRMRPDVHAQQRYFLPRHAARLDIASTIRWSAAHQLLKAFFPLAVGADSVRAEIPYGAIARVATPRTRSDTAKFELPMQRWIDASNGEWGVTIANDAKHGYDVRGDTVRISLLRAPKYPDPNADMGTHHFTYSIAPHAGDWRSGATFAAADALNRPLRVLPTTTHAGAKQLPAPLALTGDGVELGALKLAEDGETWIVRLAERYGHTTNARLVVPAGTEWRDVDFVERPTSGWQKLEAGTIQVPMSPFRVRTLEIRVAR